MDPVATTLDDVAEDRPAPDSTGCLWAANLTNVRNAITRMPDLDAYGNSTNNGYTPVNLFSIVSSEIVAASINAADDAARRIRRDAALKPFIYVIGLGGTTSNPPDHEFMRRIANDAGSASYTTTEPGGLYVWSPTSEQLQAAFLRIASEILRLAQ